MNKKEWCTAPSHYITHAQARAIKLGMENFHWLEHNTCMGSLALLLWLIT